MPDSTPPATASERKKQIVAAKNILFGTGYFLILDLPPGWGLSGSYLGPDVHSTVTRGAITWVEAGQVDQIVFHPDRRIALDLMIRIKMGKQDRLDLKGVQVNSQGSSLIGSHPASYFLGEVKQGFIKKTTCQTLRLFFYCPELRRTVFLHFTGKCRETDLREILDSLCGLECH